MYLAHAGGKCVFRRFMKCFRDHFNFHANKRLIDEANASFVTCQFDDGLGLAVNLVVEFQNWQCS